MDKLIQFLDKSFTAYQAVENAKNLLLENGFTMLSETDDWSLTEGGKYFIERNGSSLIAFTIGSLDNFYFKIIASHTDSPALKLKENAFVQTGVYGKLNTETYGGGIWYSFFDRPLVLAGRVIVNENGVLKSKNVVSPYTVCIPSVAIHMNRGVNDGFSVNAQTDMQSLFALTDNGNTDYLQKITDEPVVSYDLYAVSSEKPYTFGLNDEFLSAPRIDNLSSVFSSLESLIAHEDSQGICVSAMFDNEEVGSQTLQGAGGDLMEKTLRRIAFSLQLDESELFKAYASSFLISLDNAHAMHPNHPEKCDPTNKTVMGGGVVIKAHANKAYTTDAMSSAVIKTVFDKAGVKYQTFFNRSDMRSGSTLGSISLGQVGVLSVDLGLAQLAMHSSQECIASADYENLVNGLKSFYSTDFTICNGTVEIK